MRFLLSVFVLLVPVFGYSSVQFYFPDTDKGRACREKVQIWMNEVNKKLPTGWIPTDFTLFFQEQTDYFSYKPVFMYMDGDNVLQTVEKLIHIGKDCQKVHFIHEYGHVVQDHLMRRVSPAWQYFIIWSVNFFHDIDQTKEQLTREIETLRETQEEFETRIKEGQEQEATLTSLERYIENMESSIQNNQAKIARLSQAQEIQNQSSVSLNQFQSLKILSPFFELFADSLTVLVLDDWSAVRNAFVPHFEDEEFFKTLVFTKPGSRKEAISAYLNHRDFRRNIPLEDYPYAPWETESPYYQLAPIRSMIRETMENNPTLTPTDMIQILGLAITDVYENELIPHPENTERSLLEKNRSLAESLNTHLHSYHTK